MALLRLGKVRESTTRKGEDYKANIREYMRSLGYGQGTDSSIEAHRQDAVYAPLDERPNRQEQWVEAKNTELSVLDARFAGEVKNYLGDWLARRDAAKFRLWVFVRRLKGAERWHDIFGDTLGEEDVRQWLAKAPDAAPAIEKRIAAAKFPEVVSFFSETQVIEADSETLRESVLDRSRGASGLATPEWARGLAERMEKRVRPLAAKTEIFANLVRMQPPKRYVELEIEAGTLDEINAAFKGHSRPPFGIIDKQRLLAVETESVELDFAPVYGAVANKLDLDEVESLYPNALRSLLNRAITSIVYRRGVRRGESCFYFMASDDVAKGRGRIIRALGTHLTVAAPKKQEIKDPNEKDSEAEYFGDLRVRMPGTGKKKLSYVFHEGFAVRTVSIWGQYFVNLHLHRAFTDEGITPLPGDRAAKLDESFRSSNMNRADSQSRKVEVIAAYLFSERQSGFAHSEARPTPAWLDEFQFPGLLRVPIDWEPERVDLRDGTLFDESPDQEDEDGDA